MMQTRETISITMWTRRTRTSDPDPADPDPDLGPRAQTRRTRTPDSDFGPGGPGGPGPRTSDPADPNERMRKFIMVADLISKRVSLIHLFGPVRTSSTNVSHVPDQFEQIKRSKKMNEANA